MIRSLFTGMILFFGLNSQASAQTCGSLFLSGHQVRSETKKALDNVLSFLDSDRPDYEKIRAEMDFLTPRDLLAETAPELLSTYSGKLERKAEQVLESRPQSVMLLEDLQAQSNKLRLMNVPALRNLLSAKYQSQVGRQAWIYNRALFDWTLTVAQKAEKIRRDVEAAGAPETYEPQEKISLPKNVVELVKVRIQDIKADALITTVECRGFCGSEIHKYIKKQVGSESPELILKGGEARTIQGARKMIFVADDYQVPLHKIVLNALLEAERSGATSVALPVFRSGHAFGAVESSQREVAFETLKAVSRYAAEGKGVIKKIQISIPYDEALKKTFNDWIQTSKESYERSLRLRLREAHLSGQGFSLTPHPENFQRPLPDAIIYKTMMLPWDLKRMKDIYAPIELGTLKDQMAFAANTTSVLNMPIKMPGSSIRIPIELENFREFLQLVFDHEVRTNPHWDEFFVYLTVDQGPVAAGKTQRQPGIHIDGVQGARYPVKVPPEHTYSASNTLGTIFYPQSYDLGKLDPNKDHVHNAIWDQTDFNNKIITKDFEVYFWSSYSPHESQISTVEIPSRTFVRVEFSKKIYGSHGDTKNPLFDYDWASEHRPVPADLFK